MKRHRLTTAFAALCLLLAGVAAIDLLPAAAFAASGIAHTSFPHFGDAGGLLSIVALGGFTLNELKQKRSKLIEEMEALAKGELTDETRSAFDAKETELAKLDEDIKRAERMENVRRSAAASQAPADNQAGGLIEERAAQHPVAPQVVPQRDIGEEFGGFVRSFAMSQFTLRNSGTFVPPASIAKDLYGERHPVTEAATRAQTLNDNAAGGFTVPQNYAAGVIRLFGPNTVVRKRAQVVPGNASYLKGKTGASVGYVGENEQGQTTGVTWGLIDMKEKDISAILPISKKLLRNTAFGVEAYCRDELSRAAGEFEDLQYLRADGTGKKVKGYLYAIPGPNKIAAINKAEPTAAEVRKDLTKVLLKLAEANVTMINPAWLMAPRTLMFLQNLYTPGGENLAFPTLQGENPTLMGYPVDTTTQIPVNLGGGNNESEIFFGSHGHAMIGDSVTMTLSTSDQASFVDAGGAQVNLWAQGMLGIKLDMSHDFALRYEQAFAMLTAVKWGAA
ncbi:phage major capsid protein [Azospirillum sp. A29]|uniref:phage major capsid protein n=1 Tax=Azospirillum sp. A29 TaxID=3160606 RepID=UPI00366DA238